MWTVRRTATPAQRCPDCRLHSALCLCADLPVVWARTRVALVLHQREERKASNTGRLAVRCLPNSIVVAQGRLPEAAGLGRGLVTAPPYPWQDSAGPCVLLFPDERARPIEEWRGVADLTARGGRQHERAGASRGCWTCRPPSFRPSLHSTPCGTIRARGGWGRWRRSCER
jgi:DTW domain-containing protein YfiP